MLLYCQHNAFVLITHACLTSAGIVPSSFTVLSIFMCAVKWELLGWSKHVGYMVLGYQHENVGKDTDIFRLVIENRVCLMCAVLCILLYSCCAVCIQCILRYTCPVLMEASYRGDMVLLGCSSRLHSPGR